MEQKKEIIPLSLTNDYSDVPSWYVLCTNGLCDEERLYLYAQRNHQLPAWAEDVL